MYDKTVDHLFLYHGYAHAFGGWVEESYRYHPVSSVASSVLPLFGGKGFARERNFTFTVKGQKSDFFVSIGEAVTEVSGIVTSEDADGVYRTTVRSIVDDLKINDVVHVSHLEAVMESIHPKPEPERKPRSPKPEAKVRLGMSRIDHMTVNGKPVSVTIDPKIDDFPTFAGICKRSKAAPPAATTTTPPYAADLATIQSKTKTNTVFRCSIASSVIGKDLDICGTSIDVPEFGRVYVGELFASHGTRRLSMLRFNLGCDNCGDLTAGGGGINGDTMP